MLEINALKIAQGVQIGESIAVNGVCLTVVRNTAGVLSFEAIPETTRLSNLGLARIRDKVNLERSLKIGDRLSGHFVTGHVDCMGIIRKKYSLTNSLCFEISAPLSFMKYALPKGAIALDGISLTLSAVMSHTFRVCIIPHTYTHTTLGFRGPSEKVNIEFDILAKRAYS